MYSSAAAAARAAASSRAPRLRAPPGAGLRARPAPARGAPRAAALLLELFGALLQHLRLLRIERDLLLAAIDFELVRVHGLARLRRRRIRRRQLDANAAELVLDFGEPRRRRRFVVRASFRRARAASIASDRLRYRRANSTFSHRRISSRRRV